MNSISYTYACVWCVKSSQRRENRCMMFDNAGDKEMYRRAWFQNATNR